MQGLVWKTFYIAHMLMTKTDFFKEGGGWGHLYPVRWNPHSHFPVPFLFQLNLICLWPLLNKCMLQNSLLTFSGEITKYAAELVNVERDSHRNPVVFVIKFVPPYLRIWHLWSTEQALNLSFQAQEWDLHLNNNIVSVGRYNIMHYTYIRCKQKISH